MLLLIAACSFATLAALNVWTTWRIARDPVAFPAEKLGQILLVWCLPLAGALLSIHLRRNDTGGSNGRYAEYADPGDAMEALQDGLTGGQDESNL